MCQLSLVVMLISFPSSLCKEENNAFRPMFSYLTSTLSTPKYRFYSNHTFKDTPQYNTSEHTNINGVICSPEPPMLNCISLFLLFCDAAKYFRHTKPNEKKALGGKGGRKSKRDRLVHTVGKVQSLKKVNEKQCFQRTKLFHIVNQIFSFPYTFN